MMPVLCRSSVTVVVHRNLRTGTLEDCEIVERMGEKGWPNDGIDAVEGLNVAGVSSEPVLKLWRHDPAKDGSGVGGDSAP